jgi:large repetitive protein
MTGTDLGQELLDLGEAVGLFDGSGNLQPGWFGDPLTNLETILSTSSQRDAFMRLLDALLQPAQVQGAPADEKWHPLLSDQPRGNVYLTVAEDGSNVVFGAAGEFHSTGDPATSLRARLPLVKSDGSNLTAIAGTTSGASDGSLKVGLRVEVDLTVPIKLAAIDVDVELAVAPSPSVSVVVTLEQLDLGDGPQDVKLDPQNIGNEAIQLLIGLIKEQLSKLAGPDPAAQSIINNLLQLFGYAGNPLPAFPFSELTQDPQALQKWFLSMLPGSPPPIKKWLGYLGGLLGPSAPVVNGSGTPDDPFTVQILAFGGAAQSGLNLTLADQVSGNDHSLLLGFEALFVPSGASPAASISAQAVLASIPLTGTATAVALPSAAVLMQAPGDGSSLVTDPNINVGSLRAGLNWDGKQLQPLLELDAVQFQGTTYPKIDLTNVNSVISAASDAVRSLLVQRLNTPVAQHLAALAGLVAPVNDPGTTHLLDATIAPLLASHPTRAIAQITRAALLDNAHPWSHLLEEIAALAGINNPTASGQGTVAQPWLTQLAATGQVTLNLAAWNAQTSGNAADPQQLRIALRAEADVAPLSVIWTAELLAADLPQNAEGSIHLLAGQHASLSVNPLPAIPDVGGIALAADSLDVSLDWTPGTAIAWLGEIKNLRVTLAGNTINVGDLKLPPAAPLDFSNPLAVATSLGITVPNLEALLRLLLARVAFEWGGMPGFTIAGLLGIHGSLNGLPADWPTLADTGAAGSLFSDPFGALRNWLQTVALQLSANGQPFLVQALPWLRTLFANALPSLPSAALPSLPLSISGSGVYDDPWALPISSSAASSVDALVWLESAAGDLNAPPPTWATALSGAINGSADLPSLVTQVQALAPFLAPLRNALNGAIPANLAASLQLLATHLSTTDGVVPQPSQVPTATNWTPGTALTSPHHLQPSDPAAITQVLTQIDTWAGGAAQPRTVLLLGPPFSDHTTWNTLLANAALHGTSGQNFDLREANVDPTTIDLSKQVTQVVDYFTADLQDDGAGNIASQSAQIANIVTRIQQLRAGSVILVAHSTAGVAARSYMAATPANVVGLITLGSPHLGAPLPFLTDSGIADALRILQAVAPTAAGADPNLNALQHILGALDGYLPAAAGNPPVANPYPYGSFNFSGTPSLDTGGRPVLALGSTLTGPLLTSLQQVFSALATTAAAPNPAPPAPTHIAFGIRAHLGIPAPSAGQMAVDGWLRGDAFCVKLSAGAADPARAPHALQMRARLTRPGDWLVGAASPFVSAGAPQLDVRVRWAELGADIAFNNNAMSVTPHLELHQVSYHSGLEDVANFPPRSDAVSTFVDAQAQNLLGAVLHAIGTPTAGSPADTLITLLKAIGIAVDDPHGGVGISADAFSAITTDPVAYLGPKLQSALDTGFAGFSGPTGGPWSLPLTGAPLNVQLATGSWNIGLATPAAGLPLGDHASLVFNASLQLPNFTPSLTATLNVEGLSLTWDGTQLSVQAAPWLAPPLVLIPPPTPAQLLSRLNDVLPRLVFSSAATALLQAVTGANIDLPPLDSIFSSPETFLKSASVLGNGTQLLSSKITSFLQWLNSKAGLPAGPGLTLPAGLQLTSTGAGTDADPVRLVVATTAAINNIVGIQLSAAIDKQFHVTPAGSVSLTITGLPGGAAIWTGLTATFGASAAGATFSITPTPGSTIQILPTFSGFDAVAAAESLLPAALDQLVTTLGASSLMTLGLDVATALGIYDAAAKFSGHTDDIKKLLGGDWTNALALTQPKQAQVATAIAGLFNDASSPLNGLIPDSVTASGQTVVWKFDLGTHGLGGGTVQVTLGWDGSGPTIQVATTQLKVSSAGLIGDLSVGYSSGTLQFSTALAADLKSSLGFDVAPKVSFGYSANKFTLDLLPLATSAGNGPATIHIVPTPGIDWGSASPLAFVETWLLPLAGDILLDVAQAKLATPLWTGAPLNLQQVLVGAGLINNADPTKLISPLPDMGSVVSGLLSTLATNVSVTIVADPKLTLSLVNDNRGGVQRLGIALQGSITFDVGDYELDVLFGAPTLGAALAEGAVLYLFNAGSFQFNPGLFAVGLGLGVTGQNDSPLINTSDFRLGGVRGYVFFDCEFANGLDFSKFGAGLELDALGLPLGQATGGGVGGNPVAASLLKNDSGNGGDSNAMNPGVDVAVWAGAPDDGNFHIKFGDVQDQPLWIGVHASFGPIYIDQIGVELTDDGNKHKVGLLLDGSVKVNGLTAQVDELTLLIPLQSLNSPGDWSLDLKGLAVAFSSPGVTLAGGLLKNDTGTSIEYDGMLLIQITEFGFVAVGAYSTPTENGNTYTSLFVFVAVFLTIGIPPLIEISGFGLGVGYNRELIVPDDLNQIPNFILVAALDDNGALANDPMGELIQMGKSIPAKRGSFWLAVGLRGTSFQLVNVIAVVYVELDRGVEIGILGIARMALPTDEDALVEIELALKVRFSTADGILSIQAQLTDHSWLLSSDCQLTGGFAYFMWFPKSQFLLTMGGYNPHFQKEPEYPDVPRLGYRWSLLGAINIKGESYFALTNSCVMVGTRMEATYGPDAIHVWFTAYADFLLSWDPFYYRIDVGVSVGASFSIQVCVFGCCVGIDITVSLGATLTVQGPPFHGSVSVDLAVATITIPFGPQPQDQPPALSWGDFQLKYVYGGDQNGYATATHLLTGLLPPVPAGGKPAPGTQDQPWKLSTEWSFQTETHMPAGRYADFFGNNWTDPTQIHSIDIAPMYQSDIDSSHTIILEAFDDKTSSWVGMSATSADERFLLRADHFTIAPVISQVSEATYHYLPQDQIPAASNTLPVITGVKITGFAVPQDQSALIPIGKLVDEGSSRPLPFEAPVDIDGLKFMGVTADQLSAFVANATTLATSTGAASLLSGANIFSQLRLGAGLPAPGLGPMAVRALKVYRSAPPLLTPITTGLTMKPVGQAAPPVISKAPPVVPIHLEQPRLRVVLQARAQPVADAPASLHTTVQNVNAPGATRMAAPQLDVVAGSKLHVVAAPNAPRPTSLARPGRTLRNFDFGFASGKAHLDALTQAAADVVGNGVAVAAGVTHVWDLPPVSGQQIAISGGAAARVTFLAKNGSVLGDQELVAAAPINLPVPDKTFMVAVTCLGTLPDGVAAPAAGFGAVSWASSPQGRNPVVGWQSGNHVPQVGALSLLTRGSSLTLSHQYVPLRGKNATSDAMVQISDALATQSGVETWLPPSVSVIVVLLDQQDADAVREGDLAIAVNGATLAVPPLRVTGGQRRALLYDVASRDPNIDHIVVGAGSETGWRLAGVAGLSGQAQQWAASWNGSVPEHIVSDGPLTPHGSVNVRVLSAPGGTQ